ncbi:MAG: hypothetical protein EBR86_12715 [Planctomycetia bacterium]|jgi:hypothetical protein|nr:hypothetical protein [Planctomycetia bacterium]
METRPDHGDGLHGVQAWPTMFFLRQWPEFALWRGPIIDHLTNLKRRQAAVVDSGVARDSKSATGLIEGDFDLFTHSAGELAAVIDFIRSTVAAAACIANGNAVTTDDVLVEIPDSWYHVTNDSGYHDAHWHDGCSWCGIFYVAVGDSGPAPTGGAPNGGSRFYSPLLTGGGYRDYGNRYLTPALDVPIRDGLLTLFPSYLLHAGLPYRGREDRVVIAFNARVHLRSDSAAAARLAESRRRR